MTLAGKIALVTGSGTGIGQGIAAEFGKRGVKVAVHYNTSDSGAKETVRRIEEAGGEALLVQANVANRSEIERMVNQVVQTFGGIDILVNNAALQLNYGLYDHNEETFDRMMSINLKGYWQCMQAVVPYMKLKNRGRIILISSVHAKRPTDFDVVYSMTKGGIRMLGRESAIELGRYGITVNMIEPGTVKVARLNARNTKPFYCAEEIAKAARNPKPVTAKFPLGRVGMPSDVASLACFIASDESDFLNGSAIRLDGGSMLL